MFFAWRTKSRCQNHSPRPICCLKLRLLQPVPTGTKFARMARRRMPPTRFACVWLSSMFFGIDDPKVLTTALLHDTIEDTTTDYDDIAERFGADVARWVAALTKDMRLEEATREAEYHRVLAGAEWPVTICKLADIYDNLSDSKTLSAKGRERGMIRAWQYLHAMHATLSPQATAAYAIVEQKLNAMQSG